MVCIPVLLKGCILDVKMIILMQCSCVCPLYMSISDTVDLTNWIDWWSGQFGFVKCMNNIILKCKFACFFFWSGGVLGVQVLIIVHECAFYRMTSIRMHMIYIVIVCCWSSTLCVRDSGNYLHTRQTVTCSYSSLFVPGSHPSPQ